MQIRTLLLLIILVAIAVFATANWNAFMAPTALSLGFAEFQAPLGLIMLGLIILLTFLFLAFVVYLQATVLLETRRHAKELQVQRELADKAEASRFSELRTYLQAELGKLYADIAQSRSEILARVELSEQVLSTAVEQAGTSLSAYIGEMEDRLEQNTGEAPRPD